jgi:hypothetical protein
MFVGAVTGTSSATTGLKNLTGFVVTETAGAVATFTFRDASSGNIYLRLNLAANECVGDQFGENPVTTYGAGGTALNWYASVDTGTVRWTAFGK